MAKTKLTPTQQVVYNELKPLIYHAAKNKGSRSTPGTINKVTERLAQLTGRPIHRNMVSEWLHVDHEKRVEPHFGIGLFLKQVQTEIVHGGIPD